MKKLAFTLLLSLCAIWAQSQTTPKFQWVKGGGSQGSATNSGLLESCKWIGTDAHGNIYGMSSIFYNNIQIDTSIKPLGFGDDDFAVFSYRCDGSFRWARYFGNIYNDYPSGMFTDNNGNSFLAGFVTGDQYAPFYHYGDSSITQPDPLLISNAVVAKLDSNGHTVWLNFPSPTAFPTGGNYIAIQPDNQGNICLLALFKGVGNWDSFTIPSKGYYVLKFSPNNGNLIGVTKLDYNSNSEHSYMNINFAIDIDNSYYLVDNFGVPDTLFVGSNILIGNDTVSKSVLMKYSNNGSLSWYKEIKGTFSPTALDYKVIKGIPVIIGGFVYVGGWTLPNVNFFGVTITNSLNTNYYIYVPFIAKFNANNGNFIAVKTINTKKVSDITALGKTNNSIIACGPSILTAINQTDTIKPYGGEYDPAYTFIVSLDTSMSHFNWGISTKVTGDYTFIEYLTADLSDNIYAGGMVTDSIYNSFGVGIQSHGGTSDFFIAKIAANNNCICIKSKPNPQLVSIINHVITVKGTATAIADSLVWIWGDGTKTKYLTQNTNITHTYTSGGNYVVCLRTYNYCGIKDSCFAINGVGIDEQELKYLNAYPNPVTNSLTIENPYQCSMQLNIYSITGKLLYSNKYENYTTTLDMSNYQSGIYFIEMILADGRKGMRKVVKELG